MEGDGCLVDDDDVHFDDIDYCGFYHDEDCEGEICDLRPVDATSNAKNIPRF